MPAAAVHPRLEYCYLKSNDLTMSVPIVHSVHIYDEPSALISRLCGIVSSSLRVGDSVLIVATPGHRRQLVNALRESGVDVRTRARERRFTMFDARETLSSFMVNGKPDSGLFRVSIGEMLTQARRYARSKDQRLMVFGEMVSVLWDEGKKHAALQVEALWNDTLAHRTFHLHCAYPRSGFINADDEAAVCSVHSHVLNNTQPALVQRPADWPLPA